MSTRIVSFLGLGDTRKEAQAPFYRPARYHLDQISTAPVPFTDVATIRAAEGPVTLVLVGTAQVKERFFGPDRVFEKFASPHLPQGGLQLGFVTIDGGDSQGELWAQFTAVTGLLGRTPQCFESPYDAGKPVEEVAAPAAIWLDITRGWRNQPFFAASAVSFVQAQEQRERVEAPPQRRILYAAFNGATGEAPFRDLSTFLDVAEWDRAIDGLMRYGRADDLKLLLTRREAQLRAAPDVDHQAVPKLRTLGKLAGDFADALATGRVHHLLTYAAPRFARALDALEEALGEHAPPVAPQAARLARWARALSADSVISPEGLGATHRLLDRYGVLQRFSEQAALLRERMVDEWTVGQLPAEQILQPGMPGFAQQRKQLDDAVGALGFAQPGLGRRFRAAGDLRNDVEHCGYRPDPRAPEKVRSELATHVAALPTAFLNLSNHPSAGWSLEQRTAALALGCREVIDLAFPNVPPEADERGLRGLAEETLAAVAQLNPAAAMVAGEPGLVALLVAGLQGQGVRCYTATTRREASEVPQADGTVLKTSAFRFVRWRAFPPIFVAKPAGPADAPAPV